MGIIGFSTDALYEMSYMYPVNCYMYRSYVAL